MTPAIASALTPLLRRIDPERGHQLALRALRLGLAGSAGEYDDPALAVEAMGLRFANPIGLAAGFDKDAVAVSALRRLGFGCVETGTVTPLPQPGNPRPRLFRLPEDRAVINRMGFNNAGLAAYVARLARLPRGGDPVGANLGINKTGADPERDYPALVAAVAPHVDYIVINVSSPNTPGLRDLQGEAQLRAILRAIAAAVPQRPPLLVKLAPDLAADGLEAVVETCAAEGAQGLIVSNTTISRPTGLRSPLAREAGGLSGAPLFPLATAMLARAFLLARGRLTLIGVGGVMSGRDAFTKIAAGASLVQVYTAFAYAGPALIPRLKAELAAALREAGFTRITDAIGCQAGRRAGAA
jgi:dihydroorotate dehydrogenase